MQDSMACRTLIKPRSQLSSHDHAFCSTMREVDKRYADKSAGDRDLPAAGILLRPSWRRKKGRWLLWTVLDGTSAQWWSRAAGVTAAPGSAPCHWQQTQHIWRCEGQCVQYAGKILHGLGSHFSPVLYWAWASCEMHKLLWKHSSRVL